MGFYNIMAIGASGLSAQRLRMEVASSNLSNANTTSKTGKTYRRLVPIFKAVGNGNDFASAIDEQRKLYEVMVDKVVEDKRDPIEVYEPDHPDANAEGYVRYPNINPSEEMVGLMSAARGYEANLTAINAAKEMAKKALELAR
ncbi:flagellar basal body rod protein FlgC [bacterium]|nr:flagellar basal body rod protein FlgC [bacterium]